MVECVPLAGQWREGWRVNFERPFGVSMIRTILSDLFRGTPSTFLFCSCAATDISNAFDGESGLKNYFTFHPVCPTLIDKKAVSGRIPSSVSTGETTQESIQPHGLTSNSKWRISAAAQLLKG